MKKTLTLALAFVLVAALAIGGTVAYLTSTSAQVTNTFSVGNVNITLDEKDVTNGTTGRVTENSYKLIPGSDYEKDPTVHVKTPSERCYVFIKVENGLGTAEKAAGGAYKTIAEQMAEKGWNPVAGHAGYYCYKDVVDASAADVNLVVFEQFGIKGELSDTEYAALNGKTIKLIACAIQAEGFGNSDAAFVACPAAFTGITG